MTRIHRLATAAAAVFSVAIPAAHAQTYSNTYGVYTVTQDTGGDVPLASKRFPWPHLPYQADTGNGPRGTQQGYNICNSTTQNQDSMCQTGFVNDITDFCLWGSPEANQTVANVEEEMVAFCTKKRSGARLLTTGSLQGLQVIRTPDYIEFVGMVDQTALNLQADDTGGEEDPHGADQRGNPLGSLLYSNAFSNSSGGTGFTQVIEWSYFVGSGIFCFKACDPAGPRAAQLCQHTYDRVGCTYNAPANYAAINGTFQSCMGDDQLPVGQYVEGGQTVTWQQPAESLGPITSIPFTAAIPATSQCTTYTSSAIYTELLTVSTSSSAAPTSSASSSSSGSSGAQTTQAGASRSQNGGGGSAPSATGSAQSSSSTSGASKREAGVVGGAGMVGMVVAACISVGFALVA